MNHKDPEDAETSSIDSFYLFLSLSMSIHVKSECSGQACYIEQKDENDQLLLLFIVLFGYKVDLQTF